MIKSSLLIATCVFGLSVLAAAEEMRSSDGAAHFEARGRRDPFTFALNLPKIDDQPPIHSDKRFDLPATRKKLEELYAEAEASFVSGEYKSSLKTCELAMKTLSTVPADMLFAVPLKDDFVRIRRAAERQNQRVEAQNAFDQLGIKLSGVITRPQKSQTILNGNILREGQVLPLTADSVFVEQIRDEQVLLNFRGYRMLATMARPQ